MTASLATLNGQIVTACRVSMPAWGLWWAEVECGSSDVLKGAVSLVLDDLTLAGTIVTGGPYQTRNRYRIVGGAGGWGKSIPAKSYANDLGVKLATVLTDAAQACGEKMGTIPAVAAVGPCFPRANEPAARVLDATVPRGWYVDEAGVTQVGRRPAIVFTGQATRLVNDDEQARIDLAPGSGVLSMLVPGAIVDGVEAVDVEHMLSGADGSVRTTIWGMGIADSSRFDAAWARRIGKYTAPMRFFAPWEYRVVLQHADRLDLQIVRVSTGMPDLRSVPLRSGLLGENVDVTLGALCIVAFINGDRTRPIVVGGDYNAPPTLAKLAGGGPASARVGDEVKAWLVLGGPSSPQPGATLSTWQTQAEALTEIAALNGASPGSANPAPLESTSWIFTGSSKLQVGG